MTGGLIQLASYGGADIYITGNPEITYFKTVYRRHTNFAKESIIQHINGKVGHGRTVNIDITRAGDLLGAIWLQLRPPFFTNADTWYYTQGLGNALIKRVDLVIGGQLIDRQYGEWMSIWEELSVSTGRRPGLDAMTLTNVPMTSLATITDEADAPYLNVPLQFWFCRNPALALPIVAMSLHEIRLQIEFGSLEDITSSYIPSDTSSPEYELIIPDDKNSYPDSNPDSDVKVYASGQNMECEVWATYYHLDSDERRQLVQNPLEYLIEQVQHKGAYRPVGGTIKKYNPEPITDTDTSSDPTPAYQKQTFDIKNIRYDLGFANPVKELIWGIRPILDVPVDDDIVTLTNKRTRTKIGFGQFWGEFDSGVIRFNGQDRMKDRPDDHFLLTQNYQRHTRVPRYNKLTGSEQITVASADEEFGPVYSARIYTYSFGLNPEQHQPSGTANFTKLDDAFLDLRGITITDPILIDNPNPPTPPAPNPPIPRPDGISNYFNGLELVVYATSYNVLRIKDGMAGLAYDS